MKRILLFIFLIAGIVSNAQHLPYIIKTPTEYEVIAGNRVGIWTDTLTIPSASGQRLRAWLASKGDSLYMFSVAQQKYILIGPGTGGGGGAVTSVFGRTGIVTAQSGDYSAFYVPLSRTINGFALSSNLSLTKADIGLSAVPNVDATLRSNHTGTQLASTISDFTTAGRNLFTAGTGISYNNSTGVISATGLTSVPWGTITGSLADQADLVTQFATKENSANKANTFTTVNSTLFPTTQAVVDYVTSGGFVTTMAAIGSTPNANGATISGNTLTLQPASSSFGGVVTAGDQTFNGWKTFERVIATTVVSNGTVFIEGNGTSTGFIGIKPISSTPFFSTSHAGIWVNSDGTLHFRYESGTDYNLTNVGSGTVSSSGSANRIAYYSATGTTVTPLAAITANKAIISNGSGLPIASTTTDTEIGYVSGVTSAIQTQFTGKEATFTETTQEFTGSTSLTLTLSNTLKTSKTVVVFYNGLAMENAAFSASGTTITLSGLTRETTDKIKVKYSY